MDSLFLLISLELIFCRIVAANDVAASTAQLVAASRVKADFMSKSQDRLESASKAVTSACKSLVKQVQDIIARKNRDAGDQLDYSGLSTYEFKMTEMEQQVRFLFLTQILKLRILTTWYRSRFCSSKTIWRRPVASWESCASTRMRRREMRSKESSCS